KQKINGKPIIYFDSSCVTLKPKQVVEAMNEYYEEYPGCAGRSIHKFGNRVTDKVKESRETIAKFIGAKKPEEIIFTRNTTEGINLLAHSLGLKKGDIILTTDREHNSNLLPWQVLAKTVGIKHKIVYSKKDMTFDINGFEKIVKDAKLVSFVHTSNLDGYTLPIEEIIKIAHDNDALVIFDGAQSVPHKSVNVKKLDVDFFAFSGHKMLGPSGTGALYGKQHLLEELNPFMVGGDTVQKSTYDSCIFLKPPEKFEAGLQNYAGIVGFAAAAEYLDKIGKENIQKHEIELNRIITQAIENIDGLSIIGPSSPELRGGIISFNIEGINHHDIAMMLDERANIMIRSGQHCVHSWFNAHGIDGSARVSLYLYNTKEEAKVFIDNLKEISKLR
ncbi:MAG: aminotransferase class V-fold PLP-dependent enzyme, partial [Candidatus Aenigmarchaeota archaeon]|nr:aminotransferase class V-fold PLP-dependent enzyme [Candidatus Aenigmarchaeota archaeon]